MNPTHGAGASTVLVCECKSNREAVGKWRVKCGALGRDQSRERTMTDGSYLGCDQSIKAPLHELLITYYAFYRPTVMSSI